MKKRFLILGLVISLILVSSFVSASLCRGNDGYYHDCDDFYKEFATSSIVAALETHHNIGWFRRSKIS